MRQKIWRHVNKAGHSGYFMWAVHDVIDSDMIDMTLPHNQKMYIPTLDGGLILIGIDHTFSEETAQRFAKGIDWEHSSRYIEVVEV